MELAKIICHSVNWHFALQKVFSFMKSRLLIVDLSICTINVLFRKRFFFPISMCSRLFCTFSSIRFSVPGFILRAFTHLDWSIVQDDHNGSICILFDLHYLLQVLSFSLGFFTKNQVSIGVTIYIWVFNSIPLINVFVFMLQSVI